MKTTNWLPILILCLSHSTAFAEKMSAETQDLVIKKIERTTQQLDKKDPSWFASQKRLADLLAERARTRFMLEIENQCEGCKGSGDDRKKAIEIYETLLSAGNINEHGAILFQLAHLYQMAGKTDKTEALFSKIIKNASVNKTSQSIITQSHVGLGDLYYQKNKFKLAQEHYEIALKDSNLENRSFVIYNLAWCEMNLGQLDKAINRLVDLLKNPEKITRDNEDGKVYDAAFHADITRDLSEFLAKRDISDKDINMYEKLIPNGKHKEMMLHFANEADRIGQKKAAQVILDKYLSDPTLTQEERLQAFVSKAQVNYDRGQTAQSTQDFNKAVLAFRDSKCQTPEKCAEIQKTMKHYVTELHRSKKLKPDQELLGAYQVYCKAFPQDKEMINRGAQVAMDMGIYTTAVQFFRDISANEAFSKQEKNEALLNEVAAAEKSKDYKLQKESYIHFIKNSTDEKKRFEIKYQQAYLEYQQKHLNEAAVYFYDLAKDKSGSAELRKKSADLSLDALVLSKDDATLEKWAWEYAEVLPENKAEYAALARKALMNRVAIIANNKKSTPSELKSALKQCLSADMKDATNKEQILYFSNISVLAQKTNEQNTFIEAQAKLLAIPGLEQKQKQQINENLAAFYEQKLDFKKAYAYAQQNEGVKGNDAEYEFKLGTLADLGAINPEKHYKLALKLGLKAPRSYVVRSRIVLWSQNSVAELKLQLMELKKNAQILNDTVLVVYAKTGQKNELIKIASIKELKNKSAYSLLKNVDAEKDVVAVEDKISAMSLNNDSPADLKRSLLARNKQLQKIDQLLQISIQNKDIVSQMKSLDLMARENSRIVNELAALPQPEGLANNEKAEYLKLLKQQLKPFLYKAKLAQQKRDELWKQSSTLAELVNDYKIARPEIKKLLQPQLQNLAQVGGDGKFKAEIIRQLKANDIDTKDLLSARAAVSSNPNNIKDIEKLKILESKMGHPLMPAYLEARLNRLQKETSL